MRSPRVDRLHFRIAIGALLVSAVVLQPIAPEVSTAAVVRDWSMFHLDALHSGVTTDDAITASNVGGLSVRWQANTGAGSYVSPAVAWNATLGKRLVYAGSVAGLFAAYDAVTGDRVWYFKAGAGISSSPAIDGNVVYVGSTDHKLYALNATTGAVLCSFNTGNEIASSPVVADPDGHGKLVFVGDNGLSGADDGGHFWAINAVDPNAAADCSQR